jgi:hypothetical protein
MTLGALMKKDRDGTAANKMFMPAWGFCVALTFHFFT